MSEVKIRKLERIISEYESKGVASADIEPLREYLAQLKNPNYSHAKKAKKSYQYKRVEYPNGITEIEISTGNILSDEFNGVDFKKISKP